MDLVFLAILHLCGLFCSICIAYDGVENSQTERRNLFTEKGCCKKQSNFIYIGQDISGSAVSIDVGLCRSHCGSSQRINTYNHGNPASPKHSSMLDFIRNKKTRGKVPDHPLSTGSEPSCPPDSRCQPTKFGIQRVLLYQGIQELEIIEDCQCNPIPEECIRMPYLKTFFPDTPIESTVDVGTCSNPNDDTGLICSPTKFDSVIIEGPNGPEVLSTVENCEMKEKCYRVSYLEHHYEIVYNPRGIKEERLKEIDVGRCLGSCSQGNNYLLRHFWNRDKYMVWAEGPGNGCVPQEYETHTFRNRNGNMRSVYAITTCSCET
uniref:Uncharacterized protein n=1 Tax=Leptobrachium leishanense TaxID=445787 RepID=A0A8C5LKZ6_9ANUR